MLLGSSIAVALAQAGGYSSDSSPSLGTSICHGSSPRNGKKTKKQKTNKKLHLTVGMPHSVFTSDSKFGEISNFLILKLVVQIILFRFKAAINDLTDFRFCNNETFKILVYTTYFNYKFFFFFCLFAIFFGPLPRHMEVPRLGVEQELQPPAYARATATRDPSRVCNLHHSSRQRRIANPLSKGRDRTCNLMVPSRIR